MRSLLVVVAMTFQEASRKKILWTALAAGLGFLALFGLGLHLQITDFRPGTTPFVRYEILSGMLMVGLYTLDLLAVVITILTSVDTLAGEIATGTIQAILAKPLARWQIVLGKWLGFAAMLGLFVAIMFGGTTVVAETVAGIAPQHPIAGGVLAWVECLVALSLSFLFGSRFSALTNGVIVLGLQGFAIMAGWLEQLSGLTQGSHLATLGTFASLIVPTEAVWRRAAFLMESPLAGSLPQFAIFSDISIPSPSMMVYAVLYLLVILALALRQFQRRDL